MSNSSGNEHPQEVVVSLGNVSANDVCHLHRTANKLDDSSNNNNETTVVAILLYYGSWNTATSSTTRFVLPSSSQEQSTASCATTTTCCQWLQRLVLPLIARSRQEADDTNIQYVVGLVQVDESEESLRLCVGDDDMNSHNDTEHHPCPPEKLPVLAIAVQQQQPDQQQQQQHHSVLRYVSDIPPHALLHHLAAQQQPQQDALPLPEQWHTLLRTSLDSLLAKLRNNNNNDMNNNDDTIRIFVAGDRSSVGKSSVCLGLLGNLRAAGFPPSSLAYIKPATQCEAPPLIQKYCEQEGIACIPIGPIVYYKGFTRAYLAGQTESCTKLLEQVSHTVDELAHGKRVIVIDGVGYPSVGSICGTDNAQVALACGYPTSTTTRTPPSVLLVGGSGVGGAVDAFNLNATYFDAQNIPVLGAIFNKLSTDEENDYYSLEKCKTQVTAYFDQQQQDDHGKHHRRPFGFVPLVPELASEDALSHVNHFIRIFGKHVDMRGILDSAKQLKKDMQRRQEQQTSQRTFLKRTTFPNKSDDSVLEAGSVKRIKASSTNNNNNTGSGVDDDDGSRMTRKQIEERAAKAGAAASA